MTKKKKNSEFIGFIKEFKILSFAIAIIVGQAIGTFIQSVVNNLIMPFLNPIIKDGTWKTATMYIGPFSIGWGVILSELINLGILVIFIYIVIKKVIKYKPLK
jgi:large conductance mechanosensitive channel